MCSGAAPAVRRRPPLPSEGHGTDGAEPRPTPVERGRRRRRSAVAQQTPATPTTAGIPIAGAAVAGSANAAVRRTASGSATSGHRTIVEVPVSRAARTPSARDYQRRRRRRNRSAEDAEPGEPDQDDVPRMFTPAAAKLIRTPPPRRLMEDDHGCKEIRQHEERRRRQQDYEQVRGALKVFAEHRGQDKRHERCDQSDHNRREEHPRGTRRDTKVIESVEGRRRPPRRTAAQTALRHRRSVAARCRPGRRCRRRRPRWCPGRCRMTTKSTLWMT